MSRIAFLTYSTQLRGSVVHTIELGEALQQLGHEVCIYALDKTGQGFQRSPRCSYQAIPAAPAPADLDRLVAQRIEEFVAFFMQVSLDYEIYHAQDCLSANALAVLRSRQLIPQFVRTVHHIEAFNSVFLQACQDRSIREADLCCCVSDYWQQQLQQHYQVQAVRVINGVNLDRFSPHLSGAEAQLRSRLQITGSPVFLTIGGIEPRKNTLNLLQAFAQVRQHSPRAQLIIAGGATLFDYQDYRDRFFTLVTQLDLAASLVLPGVVAEMDLPLLYRCADAFVFPSLQEGWGLVLLEAIASGLPVITSNQPPFTEFLANTAAHLVDPQHPSAIAAAMMQVIQSDRTTQMIDRSLCSQFSWSQSATMHLEAYDQLKNHARNSL